MILNGIIEDDSFMRVNTGIRPNFDDQEDEESRFRAFRSELESGARRVRFLITVIASVMLLALALFWLKPWMHLG
jgi:hypothetical protein